MPRETKGPCTILGVRLPLDIYNKLNEMCELTHASKSAIIESAVTKYLDANLEKARELDL